jgi:hypothetical protein
MKIARFGRPFYAPRERHVVTKRIPRTPAPFRTVRGYYAERSSRGSRDRDRDRDHDRDRDRDRDHDHDHDHDRDLRPTNALTTPPRARCSET